MNKSLATLMSLLISILLFAVCSAKAATLNSMTPDIAAQLYNPEGNTIGGNPRGTVTMVELFDYNCPYCRSAQPLVEKLIAKNPDLRVVYKEYLLFGPPSELATRAALAAHTQGKYLSMHDAMMSADKPLDKAEILRLAKSSGLNIKQLAIAMNSPEVKKQIQQNTALPERLGLEGAPTFIITNSKIARDPQLTHTPQYIYMGGDDAERELQTLIDQARRG